MTAASNTEGTMPRRDRVARPSSTETKAGMKTTEMIVYVGTVIAIIVVAAVVKNSSSHSDYFRADKAMFYIVLLSLGYMISRGLAKCGSRDPVDSGRGAYPNDTQ